VPVLKKEEEARKIENKGKIIVQKVNFSSPKISTTDYLPTCNHLEGSTEKLQTV